MKKAYFFFYDSHGAEIAVNIFDTQLPDSDEEIEFIPSGTPLIIDTGGDDTNAMEPIRATTARINVLCKVGEILPLTDNLRYFVEVTKDEMSMWYGWLRAEAYTQDFNSQLSQFTYNAVDIIGAADAIRMNDNTLSMADVLHLICSKIPVNELETEGGSIIVGDSLPTSDLTNVLTTLKSKTRPENWRGEDEETREDTYSPATDFMRDWLVATGCTLTSNGLNWYIGSIDDTRYYYVAEQFELAEDDDCWTIVSTPIANKSLADINPSGDHTIDISQSCNKVRFDYGGNEYDEPNIPTLTPSNRKTMFVQQRDYNNRKGNTCPWFLIYTADAENSGIKISRVHITNNRYDNTVVTDAQIETNPLTCAAGAAFVRQDYWNTDDEDPGTSENLNDKHNYELEDVLYIFGSDRSKSPVTNITGSYTSWTSRENALHELFTQLSTAATYPVITISTQKAIAVKDGGFCLSMNIFADTLSPTKIITNPQPYPGLVCRLRFGNKWWNGTRWVSYNCRFFVECYQNHYGYNSNGAQVVNTKLLSQLYTCDGYSIPTSGSMSGVLEFQIFAVGLFSLESELVDHEEQYRGTFVTPEATQITDLNLVWCEPFENEYNVGTVTEKNHKYKTSGGGSVEYTATTSICSGYDTAENTGIMENCTSMHNAPKGIDGTLEDVTFERMQRISFSSVERINISADINTMYIPLQNFTHNGKTYRVVKTSEYDVSSNNATITLIRIDNLQ